MGRVAQIVFGVVLAMALTGSAKQTGAPDTKQSAQRDGATGRTLPGRVAETARSTRPTSGGDGGLDREQPEVALDPLERADLTAQQAMAIFAGLQLLLTFGGLVYIRWTLKATREAVKEARDATGLAETAFANQHENARRELRAYVSVDLEKAGPWQIARKPAIRIVIRNTGQTPARNLRAFAKVGIALPADVVDMDIVPYEVPSVVLGSGSFVTRERSTLHPLTSDQLQMMANGSRALLCVGKITYEDVFGDEQETNFSVHFGTSDDLPRFHRTGNDAT